MKHLIFPLLSICIFLISCVSPSITRTTEVTTTYPDGIVEERIDFWEVIGERKSIEPLKFIETPEKTHVQTGAVQPLDEALALAGSGTFWAGMLLIIVGVGSIIAKMWLKIKILSVIWSIVLILMGTGIILSPIFIDRHSTELLIMGAAALGFYLWSTWDNRCREKDKEKKQQEQNVV